MPPFSLIQCVSKYTPDEATFLVNSCSFCPKVFPFVLVNVKYQHRCRPTLISIRMNG
jgi:hypothetical protein